MLNFSYTKISSVIAVCLFAIIYSLPNFLGDKSYSFLPKDKVNLGLDLRGGSYLLLEVGFDSYLYDQLDAVKAEVRSKLRSQKVNNKRILYSGGINIKDQAVEFRLNDAGQAEDVKSILREISSDMTVDIDGDTIRLSYVKQAMDEMRKDVIDQSIEIVRRRVDETGTREPDIQRQGENRILLQVPGLNDPENLKKLLGKTAKLGFHLLNNNFPYPDDSKRPVPPDTRRLKAENGEEKYAVKKRVLISGELLNGATSGVSQFGQPVVNIRFNSVGAKKFANITKENIDKPFAILLDNKVLTAPFIRSVILGGTAEISGGFTMQEASDLAILLRAGALPAPLKIIEERTVGPSLGADSILAGKKAIIVGIILVMVLMIIIYGLFGLFSNIALTFNILLIVAVISIFGATLTLPGIAGIVLTMGMAVDANVLIFERIKEEYQLGKSVSSAINNGFSQAFKTIIDSNITTLIAALLLYLYGSGPIKGFAITLSVGILASMFSAILLTRLLVVTWLNWKNPKKLSL